jgi:uncharacterized protein
MEIEFFPSGPAIQITRNQQILVVADLHMGIESDLRLHGIHLQSRGSERIDRLNALVKEISPDIILLLGDIKHRVPGTSWQEFRELPSLFSNLRKHTVIKVTPGNHDPGIEEFLKPEELLPKEGSILDGIGVMHGHTRPNPSLAGHLILAGHHHPMASLSDEVGIALRSPCYVLAELRKEVFEKTPSEDQKTRVLMVPAFNEFSGYSIEKTFRKPFSPISRAVVIETAECLLADGTYGGDLSSVIRYESPNCS